MANYRVILTGATGGIGAALAHALAPLSEILILTGRNPTALAQLQQQLGNKAHVVAGDLTERATIEALVKQAQILGGINLLINNAGISQFGAFDAPDAHHPQEMARLLNANLLAPMVLTQALLPELKKQSQAQKKVQIINIGSVFGYIGFPGFTAYCATKFGLRGFSQALRRELWDTHISVRYFAPRATRTAINPPQVAALNQALKTPQDNPQKVAQAFLTFLSGNAFEKRLFGKEAFFATVNQLLPSLLDKAIGAQLATIQRFFKERKAP